MAPTVGKSTRRNLDVITIAASWVTKVGVFGEQEVAILRHTGAIFRQKNFY